MKIHRTPARNPLAFTTHAANAAFVPIGVVTVLLGPMLPILSAQWSLNYRQAGSLFTAQFLGSTIAVALSGAVISRCGFRFAIKAGLLAIAVGLAFLAFSSRASGVLAIGCYGIGLGISMPAINLLVAELRADHRSAALSRLNFWWSFGAVTCPFLVAAAAFLNQVRLLLVGLAAISLLVLLRIALAPSFIEPAPQSRQSSPSPAPLWNWRSGIVFAALFFLYVGTENAFGGWIASYARSLGTATATVSAITPSFFYAALTAGRWIAPYALRRKQEGTVARASLALAGVGMATLLLSPALPAIVISALLAGLGLAVIYPVAISRMSQQFGTAASRAGSVMFTMANLGGASMPWLVGYSSHRWHSIGTGFAVPLAGTLAMFLLLSHPTATLANRTGEMVV